MALFLISISTYSLFIFRNVIDSCVLILYLPALQTHFLVLGVRLLPVFSAGSQAVYRWDCWFLPFPPTHLFFVSLPPSLPPFLSYSVAKAFSAVLNTSSESGHPWLVPDLSGKKFSPLLLHMIYVYIFCYH